MNNKEKVISFGELSFCCKNQQFFRANQEVRVEPKVCELLNYLYKHQDRYVSLDELHAQLWSGRVVSDTAVRRTVSKLRTILSDNQASDQYIRSLPKRGYKLVITDIGAAADIIEEPLVDCITLPAEKTIELVTLNRAAAEDSKPIIPPAQLTDVQPLESAALPEVSKSNWYLLWFRVICLFVLLCALGYVSYNWIARTSNELSPFQLSADKVQVFALSENKQLIAYSADLTGSDGYQLFLKDLNKDFVQQLSRGENKFISAEFINQSKAILAINWTKNKYYLTQLDWDPDAQKSPQRTVLLEQTLPMTNLTVDQVHGDIFLTIYTSEQTAAIYQFDRTKQTTKAITFPRELGTYDRFPRLDKNAEILYFVRTSTNENPSFVVQNFKTGQLVKQITIPNGRLRDLHWMADKTKLLFLYTDRIVQLNLVTDEIEELIHSPSNSTYLQLEAWYDHKLLLLATKTEQRQFYLKRQSSTELLLNIPNTTYDIKFSDEPTMLYLVKKHPHGSELSILDTTDGTEKVILQTKGIIRNLRTAEDGHLLHLQIDERLAVFNQQTASLYYITNEAQQISGLGDFSHDGRFLLYSEKFAGSWRIIQFDLQMQQTKIWRENYQAIKKYPQGFVVQDLEGSLFQLANVDAEPLKLAAIQLDPDEEFLLRFPKLIQRQMREGRFQLLEFDLVTGHENILESQPIVRFDISQDSDAVLTQKIGYGMEFREIQLPN